MNIKAMTDAEIEMNLSRLQAEQVERMVKKAVDGMGDLSSAVQKLVDEAIAKATTTPKPEPAEVAEMVVIINNVPHPVKKVDLSEAFKKFKRPEPIEASFKWAGTEQELDAILAEAAEPGRIEAMAPTEPLEWVESVKRKQAHLEACPDCRRHHIDKLNQSLAELSSMIETQKIPRLREILEERRVALAAELTKYAAM